MPGGASELKDLLHLKSIRAFFKTLKSNPQTKGLLAGEFLDLLRAIRETANQLRPIG